MFSATEDGLIAFVSTEDIAEAAYQGFTAQPSLNKDLFIVGPQLFSHDEVCPLEKNVPTNPLIDMARHRQLNYLAPSSKGKSLTKNSLLKS